MSTTKTQKPSVANPKFARRVAQAIANFGIATRDDQMQISIALLDMIEI